jgi:pimeloyl-ACP methyl ester carboxylesterase
LIYFGAFTALWLGRFAAIYPFDPAQITPANAGVPAMRAHEFQSFDKTPLVVWTKQPRNRQPTIVYFHGNAGNLAGRAQRFDRMLQRGYGIVAMAYRGSSGSQGSPNQGKITNDSQFLIENLDNLGFQKPANLIYYGESLGTGVATQLALTHPPSAMILEAPFTSITDLAAKQFPIFPIRQILDQEWNSLDAISKINVPLLILHGREDKVIPFSHGQAIFNASSSSQKTLKIMDNTSHHNIWTVLGQKYIYKFIMGQKY